MKGELNFGASCPKLDLMVTLPVSEEQVVQLVKQLDPQTKQRVLINLTAERDDWWQATAREGEADLRRLAAEHGLNWDTLSAPQREAFVDDLLHER